MKRIISIILSISLLVSVLPLPLEISGSAFGLTESQSGVIGNINWTLNIDGTLLIEGAGDMPDFGISSDNLAPWNKFSDIIVSVFISSGITSIGDYSFYRSTVISVTLSQGLIEIGDGAFFECRSLTSIIIPSTVARIGNNAFANCESLTSIDIPDTLTSIGCYAFYYCTGLASFAVPEGLSSIQDYTFYHCDNIETLYIPSTVLSIGIKSFSGCSSLTTVVLSGNINSVGNKAFSGSSLEYIFFNGTEEQKDILAEKVDFASKTKWICNYSYVSIAKRIIKSANVNELDVSRILNGLNEVSTPATSSGMEMTTITAVPNKSTVSAKGDTIVVNYLFTNNSGIMSLIMGRLSTVVPYGLSIVSEKNGTLFPAVTTGAENVVFLADANIETDAVLYSATYRVDTDIDADDYFVFVVPKIEAGSMNEEYIQINCVSATVTVTACSHTETEIRGKISTSCDNPGYSGDKYCKTCGIKLAEGKEIAQRTHNGGTATCTQKPKCANCLREYGEINPGYHLTTATINTVEATEQSEGYSGDLICLDCGKTLKTGKNVAKLTPAIEILCVEDFLSIASNPDGNYKLMSDLTISSGIIGVFAGTFNGNGHTLYVSDAVFDTLLGATVVNLDIRGKIESNDTIGALAKYAMNDFKIINVTNYSDVSSTGENAYVGGIVGSVLTGTATADLYAENEFTNCANYGNIHAGSKTPRIGGISGNNAKYAYTTYANCVNYGNLNISQDEGTTALSSTPYAGGIAASSFGGRFVNCLNKGTITSTFAIYGGGIVGRLNPSSQNADQSVEIISCTNEGEITAYGGSIAGMAGHCGVSLKNGACAIYTITKCVNSASILQNINGYAGGIAGYIYGQTAVMDGSTNVTSYQYGIVDGCVNFGTISGDGCLTNSQYVFSSQILAYSNSVDTVISKCYAVGKNINNDSNHAVFIGLSTCNPLLYRITNNYIVENDGTVMYTYANEEQYLSNRKSMEDISSRYYIYIIPEGDIYKSIEVITVGYNENGEYSLDTNSSFVFDRELGDVNADGRINLKDVVLLTQYLAGINVTVYINNNADVNKSNKVDIFDLIRLRKYVSNIDPDTGKSSVILGHIHEVQASSSWHRTSSYHYKSCYCGAKINYEEHTFGEWVVVQQPTTTRTGRKKHTCTVCGVTISETIPALDSN